jgi:hypothetical protein
MLKRTHLILLFMVVFSGAFLMGNIPEGKADPPISVSQIEYDGQILVIKDGNTEQVYWKDADGNLQLAFTATSAWITNGPPDLGSDPINGRKINFTTEGAATGSLIRVNGRYIWVYP